MNEMADQNSKHVENVYPCVLTSSRCCPRVSSRAKVRVKSTELPAFRSLRPRPPRRGRPQLHWNSLPLFGAGLREAPTPSCSYGVARPARQPPCRPAAAAAWLSGEAFLRASDSSRKSVLDEPLFKEDLEREKRMSAPKPHPSLLTRQTVPQSRCLCERSVSPLMF